MAAFFHGVAHTGLTNQGCKEEGKVNGGLCIIGYDKGKKMLILGKNQEYIKNVLGIDKKSKININGFE